MRHRTAGLDHQAGSLLPELRGVLLTLARHTDNLPAGPAVPPVRCPPSRVNPSHAQAALARLSVRLRQAGPCGSTTHTVDGPMSVFDTGSSIDRYTTVKRSA